MKTQTKDYNKKEETTSLPTTTSQASTSVEALGNIPAAEISKVSEDSEETPAEKLVAFTFFCNVIEGKTMHDAKETVMLPLSVAERHKRNHRGEF